MNKMMELVDNNLKLDMFAETFAGHVLVTNGKVNDKYYLVLKNYKVLFEKYLIRELDLGSYDNMLKNANLLFKPVKNEEKDCYQLASTMGLDYIYLRSYLHVEKLSVGDINLIAGLSEEQMANPSAELFSLIEKTYKAVIDSNFSNDIVLRKCYGADSPRFWYNSAAIVFGIKYDRKDNGLVGKEWLHNNFRQIQFVNELIAKMQKEISDKLGVETGVILYNR